MRSLRFAILLAILLALLIPLAAQADGPPHDGGYWGYDGKKDAGCRDGSNPCYGTSETGPCPDDPKLTKECVQKAPPFYVVVNRNITCPNRTGSGCAPIILKHPECKDCSSPECAAIDVEKEVCQTQLKGKVAAGKTEVVYEMCCRGEAGDTWLFRLRLLDSEGRCPVDPANPNWIEGLPPGTGVTLPAPLVVGGLSVAGAGLLAVGLVIRRRGN